MFYLILLLPMVLFTQTVRVCVLETNEKTKISLENVSVLYTEEARYQLTPSQNPFFVYKKDDLIIFEGNGRYFKFQNSKDFYLKPRRSNHSIQIGNDFVEQGRIEFHIGNEKLQIIVESDIDRYISYVTPNEIYTHDENYFEAIKAQVIASRTYSLNRLGQYQTFDVYADVRDQMYKSNIEIPELVQKAVKETSKLVLLHNDKLIDAKYSASVGGVAEQLKYTNEDSPLSMKLNSGEIVGTMYDSFKWKRSFRKSDIIDRFNSWFPVGAVTQDTIDRAFTISVINREKSGRIDSLKLKLNTSVLILTKLDIRKFFHTNGSILPSTLCAFSEMSDRVIISGYGNGHGEGMGQWEAMELSKNGYSYLQILDFFYPKTYLGKGQL